MLGNSAPGGAVDGPHVRRHVSRRLPSALPGQASRHPLLHVETPDQILDVANLRLDLRDKQQPPRRVVRENVDASSIAVVIEARLDVNEPAVAA